MLEHSDQESAFYETNLYRCLVKHKRQSDDLYLITCGIEKCLPEYEFHTNNRPGYHLHVILAGKGLLCVDKEEQELHMGQFFLTKPGEQSWYRADKEAPWTYCWMAFDGKNAKKYIENAGFYDGINWCDCHVDQQRFYSLARGVLDHPELTLARDLMHTGCLLEFIGLAIESNYNSKHRGHHENDYSTDVYVDYAVSYIQANYAMAKVSDVARYIGIHRSYLTSIFKKKMGLSPQEYLLQYKLNKSCELLLETQLSIQEIASRVGYENPLTFSKIFKSFYGISPKHFRLRMDHSAVKQI